MREQRLGILLEDRGDHNDWQAVLHVVEGMKQVASHQEINLADRQQRPVVHLRSALTNSDVQAIATVGAVGEGLVEAAMRCLRFPVGCEADVIEPRGLGRRSEDGDAA